MPTSRLGTPLHAPPQINSLNGLTIQSLGASLGCLIAVALGLLMLPTVGGTLLAQDSPDAGEYPPDSAYAQPGYPQQPYGERSFGHQGYADSADTNSQGY